MAKQASQIAGLAHRFVAFTCYTTLPCLVRQITIIVGSLIDNLYLTHKEPSLY